LSSPKADKPSKSVVIDWTFNLFKKKKTRGGPPKKPGKKSFAYAEIKRAAGERASETGQGSILFAQHSSSLFTYPLIEKWSE